MGRDGTARSVFSPSRPFVFRFFRGRREFSPARRMTCMYEWWSSPPAEQKTQPERTRVSATRTKGTRDAVFFRANNAFETLLRARTSDPPPRQLSRSKKKKKKGEGQNVISTGRAASESVQRSSLPHRPVRRGLWLGNRAEKEKSQVRVRRCDGKTRRRIIRIKLPRPRSAVGIAGEKARGFLRFRRVRSNARGDLNVLPRGTLHY